MDSRSKILFVLAAMLPVLVAGIPPETEKMFADVCAKSENPNSCVSRLSQNPKASSAIDIKAVVTIALAAVTEESRNAQGVLRQAEQSNPEAAVALTACMKNFDDTLLDLVYREKDLKNGESTLNVHYALDFVESCEAALAAGKFSIQAVTDEIHQWKDIFGVAYDAVMKAEN